MSDGDVGEVPALQGAHEAEGLRRPRQLQNYATARVEKFLTPADAA